jgi:hypothetical protein
MRFAKGLLVGLVAAGLVGCSGSGPAAGPSASGVTQTGPPPPATPAVPHAQAGARAAAVQFDHLYLAGQFAASWGMLTPTVKRQIPRGIWVKVHNGCPSAKAGTARDIKAVTVFGTVAIVSERLAGTRSKHGTAQEVFNYDHGRWGYSPNDLSVYHHGSVAADIAAAKTAGLCVSWKGF